MNLKYWTDYIYAFLPKTVSSAEDSTTFTIIQTIANELLRTFYKKEEVKLQVPVVTATEDSLDRHAIQFGLIRVENESDEDFRQRIIDSFIKSQLTKQNLKALADTIMPELNARVEEPIYDRWFLTPLEEEYEYFRNNAIISNHLESIGFTYPEITKTVSHIEQTASISKTVIGTYYPIYEITNIWLQSDIYHSGTNYAEYVIYPVSIDNTITLSIELPSDNIAVEVWYKEKTAEPKYQYSWLMDTTIMYPRNLSNNIGTPTQSPTEAFWITNSFPTTVYSRMPNGSEGINEKGVQVLYFDANYLIQHSWLTKVEKTISGEYIIRINNSVKTSEEIKEEVLTDNPPTQRPDQYTLICANNIAGVSSITSENGTIKTSDIVSIVGKVITLRNPMPSGEIKVTYTKSSYIKDGTEIEIKYDSTYLIPERLLVTGFDDPKNCVYIWLESGEIFTDDTQNLANSIKNNVAAGLRVLIGLYSTDLYYGDFYYGEGYYGGESNPTSTLV